MKRNGIISFWKFIFAIMIVIFHGKILANDGDFILFKGGYIGVEFFFIVSGVLLAGSIIKVWDKDNANLGKDTWKFIWNKVVGFIPYVVIAYVLFLPIVYKFNGYSISKIASSIWEVLLLGEAGIKSVAINVPIWYLSSMLLSMAIIYPLMRKFKMNYVYFIVPLVVILGIGFLTQQSNTVDRMRYWLGFTYYTNIRAFVELNLGILIYFIAKKIKEIKFTFIGRLFLTIIELGCLSAPFLIAMFISNSYRYDYVLILVIAIGVCIAFSEKTLEYNLLSNNLVFFFEKLSLPLYILHSFCCKTLYFLTLNANISYVTKISIHVLISLVFALVMLKVIGHLQKKRYYVDKFKHIFIQE